MQSVDLRENVLSGLIADLNSAINFANSLTNLVILVESKSFSIFPRNMLKALRMLVLYSSFCVFFIAFGSYRIIDRRIGYFHKLHKKIGFQ